MWIQIRMDHWSAGSESALENGPTKKEKKVKCGMFSFEGWRVLLWLGQRTSSLESGDLGIITVGAKSLEAAVSIGPLFRRKFKYNY
jgi:hypothetical protein